MSAYCFCLREAANSASAPSSRAAPLTLDSASRHYYYQSINLFANTYSNMPSKEITKHYYYKLLLLPAGVAKWQPAGIVFTQQPKINILPPSRKNYELDRKMVTTFQDGHDELCHHAKFGRIEQRMPAVGAKKWCLFFVTLRSGVPWDTQFEQSLRRGLWINFDAVSDVSFRSDRSFRSADNSPFRRQMAPQYSRNCGQNCEKSKNQRKSLCAPLRIHIVINSSHILQNMRVTISCRYCITYEVMLLFLVKYVAVAVLLCRQCCEFVDLLLQTWPTSVLERQNSALYEAIKKGISDADPDARLISRR